MKNPIKTIIFDFDETLVASRKSIYEGVKLTGKKYFSVEITDEQIDSHFGKPFHDFVPAIFDKSEDLDKTIELYTHEVRTIGYDFYEGVREGLKELSERYELGVVSASDAEIIKSFFQNKNLPTNIFTFIQGSHDSAFHKPDGRVFEGVTKKLKVQGIEKNEILYVGDSSDDYLAAKDHGINFLGIDFKKLGTFKKIDVDYVNDFEELVERLK